MDLLDQFALFQTQLVKIHAELHQAIAVDESLNANVEMKLTPGVLPNQKGNQATYQLGVRLHCRGTRPDKDDPSKTVAAFTVECVLNAGYQQMNGEPVDFETFSKHHVSLTRQLYPLIRQQLLPLFSQLGIANVRLPQEIIQSAVDAAPRQVH
ncbi:MAG: hypothetical protein AB8B96_20640 [Lysobacterales bacterium]